ncbi:hypothetical protein MNBD_ALPHA02-1069 [hydrothermal vent metagenome]|uniref:Uncharacterized protein n=1 Tax=hydrothermal vent metagenome TaxID=652676 RepID=A0A3B0R2U7_9ZZZZ
MAVFSGLFLRKTSDLRDFPPHIFRGDAVNLHLYMQLNKVEYNSY